MLLHQVWEAAQKIVEAEELHKQKLCEDLKCLVCLNSLFLGYGLSQLMLDMIINVTALNFRFIDFEHELSS